MMIRNCHNGTGNVPATLPTARSLKMNSYRLHGYLSNSQLLSASVRQQRRLLVQSTIDRIIWKLHPTKMVASFPLAVTLAGACLFLATLPTTAAPAMTSVMAPHDVTNGSKMTTTDVTSDQEIEKLQAGFDGESSGMLLKYIIGPAKESAAQPAADTTPKPSVPVDMASNVHRRFQRSADSTPGYSANPLEVHAANLSLDPIAEFTGYTAKDSLPDHYGEDYHGIGKYAPAHYIPPAARDLARNRALARANTLAPSPTSVPTPTQTHSSASTLVHTLAHTTASAQAPTLAQTAASAPAPALAHAPAFASSPAPKQIKSILIVWNRFLTKPLQENYDKFVAILPAKSIRSLLLDHQHLDFTSVQDYRADREGFVSAMQKVYQVPKEQLGEVEDFYDMMTKVLPSKFFGKERSVADLIRQIRLYFAMKQPRVKVMSTETVAHYNLK